MTHRRYSSGRHCCPERVFLGGEKREEVVRGGFEVGDRSHSFGEVARRQRRCLVGGLGRWCGCRSWRGRCEVVERGGIVVGVVVVGLGGEEVVWIGRLDDVRSRRTGDWSASRVVGWVVGVAAEGWIVCVDIGRSRVVLPGNATEV